mmetsp:Transcript_94929/g.164821  ORF Transcript_94929/g.164821 Transcript_94929/m.164821 type:complete len:228 (-) Transcript_94929:265-948(-)
MNRWLRLLGEGRNFMHLWNLHDSLLIQNLRNFDYLLHILDNVLLDIFVNIHNLLLWNLFHHFTILNLRDLNDFLLIQDLRDLYDCLNILDLLLLNFLVYHFFLQRTWHLLEDLHSLDLRHLDDALLNAHLRHLNYSLNVLRCWLLDRLFDPLHLGNWHFLHAIHELGNLDFHQLLDDADLWNFDNVLADLINNFGDLFWPYLYHRLRDLFHDVYCLYLWHFQCPLYL